MNKIAEIENLLPNGFHDSHLFRTSVDYSKKEAEIFLEIDLSESNTGSPLPVYRRAKLNLYELAFFIIEPPELPYEVSKKSGLDCDAGPLEGDKLLKVFPKGLSKDFSAYWFFSNSTNSFIYMACKKADFEWLDK